MKSMEYLQYDRRTIFFHWLTVGLVASLWTLGQTIDWFPKSDRVYARSTHIVLGVALGLVLIGRIRWRIAGAVHLPPAGPGRLDKLATLTHYLLYALLIGTVLLGLANAWERGDNVFNLFSIPAFDPKDKDLRATIEDWHGLAANTLLSVAAFHAAAALIHRFVWKDQVLGRMLPRGRRIRP